MQAQDCPTGVPLGSNQWPLRGERSEGREDVVLRGCAVAGQRAATQALGLSEGPLTSDRAFGRQLCWRRPQWRQWCMQQVQVWCHLPQPTPCSPTCSPADRSSAQTRGGGRLDSDSDEHQLRGLWQSVSTPPPAYMYSALYDPAEGPPASSALPGGTTSHAATGSKQCPSNGITAAL